MTSLGILSLSNNSEKSYINEMAKYAKEFSISLYRFTPIDINPQTELVTGEAYDSTTNSWTKATFPIPAFIYDRCFYGNKDIYNRFSPIANWLKKRPGTYFLGHGLPDKWAIYKLMADHPLVSFYIPATQKVTSNQTILRALKQYKSIVIKPLNGSQGRGVIQLSLLNDGVEIRTQRNKKLIHKIISNKEVLLKWLDSLFDRNEFILQPYLPLKNKDHQPFDVRILFQKDKDGNWIEAGRGVRIGEKNHLISNLHGGGQVLSFDQWLQSIPKKQQIIIEDEIDSLKSDLPDALEKQAGPLFEIGIDIGVEDSGAIWIIDINSKPGHKVALQTSPKTTKSIYCAPLHYCHYLKEQHLYKES